MHQRPQVSAADAPRFVVPLQSRDVATFFLGLAAYLVLDWVTFTPQFALSGLTPWNPPIGLALAVVVRKGLAFLPLLFVAPLLDDLFVRALPFPSYISAGEAALTGIGYSIALWALQRSRWMIDRDLHSMRDLARMLALLCGAALLVSLAHNLLLLAGGHLTGTSYAAAVVRYWIGEVIGILVVLPFALLVWRSWARPAITLENVLQACAMMSAITIVFGLAGQTRLHFSYVLFLPVIWTALRSGLAGAATGLMIVQVGIMIALHVTGDQPSHVPAFQALMVALALTGLTIGVLVDERNRNEQHLRRQQEAMARAARIGTLGEFTTTLAHELNQPLTAAGNFTQLLLHALDDAPPDHAAAREAGRSAKQQIDRGTQIIRRMREFIRVGRLEIAACDLSALIAESLALIKHDLERLDAVPEVRLADDLPPVAVDPLQIEQVLVNLLRNALEAVEPLGRAPRILIAAAWPGGDHVEVAITDNGCGFPPGFDLRHARAIESPKSSGLGVGLSLCVSIVESHGGRLETGSAPGGGAVVRLELPVFRKEGHA